MDIQEYIINNYGLTTKSITEMSQETGYTKELLRTLACKLGVKRNSVFKDFEDEFIFLNTNWVKFNDYPLWE